MTNGISTAMQDNPLKYKRLSPPYGLGIREKKVWEMVVATKPADFFDATDTIVLTMLCTSIVRWQLVSNQLGKDLEKSGAMLVSANGAVAAHPLIKICASLETSIANLCVKARLTVSSRLPTKGSHANVEAERIPDEIDALFFSG